MRINVYQEEISGEVTLVEKADVVGADGNPVTFYGVRVWLLGPDTLHVTEHDDDRSAITFWCGSKEHAGALFSVLEDATGCAREAYRKLPREQP